MSKTYVVECYYPCDNKDYLKKATSNSLWYYRNRLIFS